MNNWKEYKVGEMIDCNPTVKLKKDKEYPIIDIDKIEIGRRFVTNKETAIYDGQSSSKFQNGDTLLARITPCLENGKVATCKIDSEYGFGSTEFFVFRGLKDKTDNDFVFYFMSSSFIRKLAANSMTGASGRQRADLDFIKNRKFFFPPLPTQQKIAGILSKYDEAIENNSRRIKLLEQMAQNLYKEWFVRFRFPGWQTAEFENGIPKGWKQGRFEELLEFKRGKNITADEMQDGNVPVISAGLAPSGYHNESNVVGTSLTISSSGANAGYLSIHYEDIWAADCMFVSGKNTADIYYLYELLNNIRPVIENQQRGAAQPHVYSKDINRLRLWIPEKKLIDKANSYFEKIHQEIYQLQKQTQNLSRQRDLLLPRLMSGKLQVLADTPSAL